jgi:hypothetical protein
VHTLQTASYAHGFGFDTVIYELEVGFQGRVLEALVPSFTQKEFIK